MNESDKESLKILKVKNSYYGRKATDYLRYLRFEATNAMLHIGCMIMDFLMIYIDINLDFGVKMSVDYALSIT